MALIYLFCFLSSGAISIFISIGETLKCIKKKQYIYDEQDLFKFFVAYFTVYFVESSLRNSRVQARWGILVYFSVPETGAQKNKR